MIDLDFYRGRQREEEEAANSASSKQAAKVHRELAQRYDAVVKAYEELQRTKR